MNRMLPQLPPVFRPLHVVLAFISCLAVGACTDGSGPSNQFTITPDTASVFIGGTRQFTAFGAPGTVEWTSSNQSVATVIPQTGSATALARGTSQITATSSTTAASATLTVLAPPSLSVSTPVLEFEQIVGAANPAAQTVTITNAGDLTIDNVVVGPISYGSGEPSGWLSATESGATTPVTVTVQPTGAGLRGTYTATVPFFADGIANSPQHVAVTFRVRAQADIEVSRTTVAMSGIQGATLNETVEVTNSGDLPLTGLTASVTYGAGQSQGWLTATLGSGSAPTTLTLVAGTSLLAPGSYSATVRLTSSVAGVAPVDIEVPLTVAPGPAIQLSSSTIDVSTAHATDAGSRTVTVTNSGGGTLSNLVLGNIAYGAGEPTGWLDGSLDATTAPATITLAFATASLASGNYTATLPVQSSVASNSPVSIVVNLSVGEPDAPAGIQVSRTSVPMTGIPGVTLNETVEVTNSGEVPLTGLSAAVTYGAGQTEDWLTATFSPTTAPATLTLVGNTSALAAGSYSATVRVSSTVAGVAPVDIDVPLTVLPGPAIALSSGSIDVTADYATDAASTEVDVTNGGGGTLSGLTLGTITYGTGQPTDWLDGSLDTNTAPATITLTFATAALASGSYTATLPVQSSVASNSPVGLVVNLTVGPAPMIAVNPGSATFAVWGGAAQPPASQAVQITNTGGGTLSGLSASIGSYTGGSPNWLTATFSGGTTATTTLLLRPNTTALTAATRTAVVTISSTVPGVASRTINVTYTTQTFTTNVFPFFTTAGCSGCHSSLAPAIPAGTNAQTYYNRIVPAHVIAGNPVGSNLVCKIFGLCSHAGGKYTSTTGFQAAVTAWINAGAPFQ